MTNADKIQKPATVKVPSRKKGTAHNDDESDGGMSVDENRDEDLMGTDDELPEVHTLFTDIDIRRLPTVCPITGCNDPVPDPCPQDVQDLFRNRKPLGGALMRNFEICQKIKEHSKRALTQAEFRHNEYPTEPVWKDLPRRLSNDKLHAEVRRMLEGKIDMETILQFQTLRDALGSDISFKRLDGGARTFPVQVYDCTGGG